MAIVTKTNDIIAVISELMLPFGYDLHARLAHRDQRYQVVRTIIITLHCLYVLVVAIIQNHSPETMMWLCDLGFYLLGSQLRNLMNAAILSFRLQLVFAQLLYFQDDFIWMIEANHYFHKLNSLRISSRILRLASKTRPASFSSLVFTALVCIVCIVANQEIPKDESFVKFIIPCVIAISQIPIHYYYTGMFISKMYLLMIMSSEFCVQFKQYFRNSLRISIQADTLDSRVGLIKCIQEFTDLYLLIHYLNSYLKKAYISTTFFQTLVALFLFYMEFYENVSNWIRAAFVGVILASILVVIYLSSINDSLNNQCEQMANSLYKTIVIDEQIELNTVLKHQHQIKQFLACANSNTMGLQVMGNPINTQTTITVCLESTSSLSNHSIVVYNLFHIACNFNKKLLVLKKISIATASSFVSKHDIRSNPIALIFIYFRLFIKLLGTTCFS